MARARSLHPPGWPVLVLALAMASLGCRPARPVVGSVVVTEGIPLAHLQALGLRRDDLRREALEALGAAGFRVQSTQSGSADETHRASISVLQARPVRRALPDGPPESEELRMEVLVELRLEPARSEEGSLREAGRWSEPVRSGESDAAALRRAVAGASRKAAADLMLGISEAGKPDRELIADLDSGDSRVRDHAMRVLADRKNPAAVPALIARLRDSDPELVERAVGALDQLRDPRAVEPLIELSHHREGPFVAQLARIIGDIGGSEADAYLLTLASGHPEPIVRQAAEQALAQSRQNHPAGGRALDGGR